MDDLIGFTGISQRGLRWLWAAGAFLLPAMVVSTCRRMLTGFSRKVLLDEAGEGQRSRMEELLHRVDDHGAALEAADHVLRLGLFSSLAFTAISFGPEPVEGREELLSFLWFLAGLLVIQVFFLELIPSVFARVRPEGTVRRLLPVLDRINLLLRPIGRLYGSVVRAGARAVGGNEERTSASVVEEEILTAVEEGERKGLLREDDASMIESIIRFRDREVSEVMTRRTDMVCLDIEESLEASIRVAIECGHSRIPVYRENNDNIAGILYVKDLLRFWKQRQTGRLGDIIRQAHFVPASKKISQLFHEFKSQRFHIAIILDEFGGTAGLITIEDIIEEIVGEIADELEKEGRPEFQRLGEDLVEVDARLPLQDLNVRLELELPEDDGYETVGGFLFSAMGKIPAAGESFEYGRLRFEILEADERKISRLRIRIDQRTPRADSRPAAAREVGRKE